MNIKQLKKELKLNKMKTLHEEAEDLLEENYNYVMHLKISGNERKTIAKKNLLLCLDRQIDLMKCLDIADRNLKYNIVGELYMLRCEVETL
tara:strand:- start:281 stop:553 length:273 start_codon:yes stop_codon:yes gene_type:complete